MPPRLLAFVVMLSAAPFSASFSQTLYQDSFEAKPPPVLPAWANEVTCLVDHAQDPLFEEFIDGYLNVDEFSGFLDNWEGTFLQSAFVATYDLQAQDDRNVQLTLGLSRNGDFTVTDTLVVDYQLGNLGTSHSCSGDAVANGPFTSTCRYIGSETDVIQDQVITATLVAYSFHDEFSQALKQTGSLPDPGSALINGLRDQLLQLLMLADVSYQREDAGSAVWTLTLADVGGEASQKTFTVRFDGTTNSGGSTILARRFAAGTLPEEYLLPEGRLCGSGGGFFLYSWFRNKTSDLLVRAVDAEPVMQQAAIAYDGFPSFPEPEIETVMDSFDAFIYSSETSYSAWTTSEVEFMVTLQNELSGTIGGTTMSFIYRQEGVDSAALVDCTFGTLASKYRPRACRP